MTDARPGPPEQHSPLSVTEGADGTWFGECHSGAPGRAFGGQVAAQALMSAAASVAGGRYVTSLHAQYVVPGEVALPIRYEVDALYDGRSFCSRVVHARQAHLRLAQVTVSFAVRGAAGHAVRRPAPSAPPPQATAPTPFADSPSGREFRRSVEQRVVFSADAYDGVGQPAERRWMRLTTAPGTGPFAHAAGLAYLSDIRLASAPAAHLRAAGRKIAVTTLDHTIWWHRPLRADQWLLFHIAAVSMHRGIALSTADLFTEDGEHVASTAQQALIRVTD